MTDVHAGRPPGNRCSRARTAALSSDTSIVKRRTPTAQRPLDHRAQQQRADTLALPGIRDGHRHLGGLGVVRRPDEARDADRAVVVRGRRDDGHVVASVDGGEPPQVRTREAGLGCEEAQPARPGAHPGEDGEDRRGVTGRERSQLDAACVPRRRRAARDGPQRADVRGGRHAASLSGSVLDQVAGSRFPAPDARRAQATAAAVGASDAEPLTAAVIAGAAAVTAAAGVTEDEAAADGIGAGRAAATCRPRRSRSQRADAGRAVVSSPPRWRARARCSLSRWAWSCVQA